MICQTGKVLLMDLLRLSFQPKSILLRKLTYTANRPEAILMVAWGLIMAKPSFHDQLSDFGDHLSPNVGKIDGYKKKVYDRAVVCKPNLEVIKEITGDMQATLLSSKDESLYIMKMPSFPNDWKKETVPTYFPPP